MQLSEARPTFQYSRETPASAKPVGSPQAYAGAMQVQAGLAAETLDPQSAARLKNKDRSQGPKQSAY
jgi:hypothetical protein